VIFKFIFFSQRFSTQLALKKAAQDRFIIQSSGYLSIVVSLSLHKTDKSQYDTNVSPQELIVNAFPPLRMASALSKSIALG